MHALLRNRCSFGPFLIAHQHFVDATVRIGTDGFPEAHRARGLREALAAAWLAGNGDDYADTPVRFDEVAMMVVKENRALLRHHVNCFGEMEPLS